MNRKRKETESYKEYRDNLRLESARLKAYLRGRVLWNRTDYADPTLRTYKRKVHGDIGTK